MKPGSAGPGVPGLLPALLLIAALGLVLAACGGQPDAEKQAGGSAVPRDPLAELPLPLRLGEPQFGDLDSMVEERVIRVVTTFSRTGYFLDGGRPRGATYEALTAFEKFLNRRLGSGRLRVHLLIVPVARDQLLPLLTAGRADLAAANLSITPERLEKVAFSDPVLDDVAELIVTGPSAPPLTTLDDLAGQDVHVRLSSSYAESLRALNEDFASRGLEPMRIIAAHEILETEDLMELVATGALPMTVADRHLADAWRGALDGAVVREDLAITGGRSIAWAMRPESPQLKAEVDAFVAGHRQGTLYGNVLMKRYFNEGEGIGNPLERSSLDRFESLRPSFEELAARYGLDWILVAAQAYQESKLDHSLRSAHGAVGIMQIKPATAADPNVGIPDIKAPYDNMHAGIKYLRFLRDRYFGDESLRPIDEAFFALAAYNAGPSRIARFRRRAEEQGLDPDVWFRQVEQVAGRETVDYVSNIFKYWVAYREHLRRTAAVEEIKQNN